MQSSSTHSDQDLVALLKAGDDSAFTEIYSRYALILFRQADKMLHDREASKDLVQELFITLWNNADQLKEELNLAGYLYIAVRNRVFKLIEKGKVRNDYLNSIARYATELSTETTDQLEEKDLQLMLQREIDLLPLRMKEVFELSRKQNLSYAEIALQLGISDKTVKKQINKALKVLRSKLGAFFFVALIVDLLSRR